MLGIFKMPKVIKSFTQSLGDSLCIADMIQWQKIPGHGETASYFCLNTDCDGEEQREERQEARTDRFFQVTQGFQNLKIWG